MFTRVLENPESLPYFAHWKKQFVPVKSEKIGMIDHPLARVRHPLACQQKRTDWRWLGCGLCFKDIKPYRAFVVDGIRWIKIPLNAGVNATKPGGGKSTHFFGDYQTVEKADWNK